MYKYVNINLLFENVFVFNVLGAISNFSVFFLVYIRCVIYSFNRYLLDIS